MKDQLDGRQIKNDAFVVWWQEAREKVVKLKTYGVFLICKLLKKDKAMIKLLRGSVGLLFCFFSSRLKKVQAIGGRGEFFNPISSSRFNAFRYLLLCFFILLVYRVWMLSLIICVFISSEYKTELPSSRHFISWICEGKFCVWDWTRLLQDCQNWKLF